MRTQEITNEFGIKQTLVNMSISEMKSMSVDRTNFHDCTVADWTKKDVEFIADYKSGSGSEYMFTEEGVYRKSNHWLYKVNTCIWLLDGSESDDDTIAFCKYEDFKKYSSIRDSKHRISNNYSSIQINIIEMINGGMVLSHRIGSIY